MSRNPGSLAVRSQVDTAAFKAWFSESKVVDGLGRPLKVYHGTQAKFTQFRVGGDGIFFGEDESIAGSFSRIRTGESRIIPVYLSIQNPWMSVRYDRDFPISKMVDQSREGLIQKGYDGFHRPEDGVWVAFLPEQIKSAISNGGEFCPDNPDIYMSRVGRYRSG